MKYDKCEFCGCGKKGTHKVKNGHHLCDTHYRLAMHNHKVKKHNVFYKELVVGNVGGYSICINQPVKFI